MILIRMKIQELEKELAQKKQEKLLLGSSLQEFDDLMYVYNIQVHSLFIRSVACIMARERACSIPPISRWERGTEEDHTKVPADALTLNVKFH